MRITSWKIWDSLGLQERNADLTESTKRNEEMISEQRPRNFEVGSTDNCKMVDTSGNTTNKALVPEITLSPWKTFAIILDRIFLITHSVVITAVLVYYITLIHS